MTANRSESGAVGNTKYSDLNMTFYPTKVDNKVEGQDGYNRNMKGFWDVGDANKPAGKDADYVMAEHVNALADAVIAIQRVLGIEPYKDNTGSDQGTVSNRIKAVENKDSYYDARYGGQGWTTALGQTILAHHHGGSAKNQAPQINLASEVTGVLPKANVDITQATGITGQDLMMSTGVSTKISDAIADKLSISQGGTIQKNLTVKGSLTTRTYKEWSAADITTGTQQSDATTSTNISRRYSGTAAQNIIDSKLDFLCGKYVVGVRLRASSQPSEIVASLQFRTQDGTAVSYQPAKSIYGTDFDAVGEWQMFYYVFDLESFDNSGNNSLQIARGNTSSSVNVDFDCAWVMPIHPAVFDK